jgi:hypothetical protein
MQNDKISEQKFMHEGKEWTVSLHEPPESVIQNRKRSKIKLDTESIIMTIAHIIVGMIIFVTVKMVAIHLI